MSAITRDPLFAAHRNTVDIQAFHNWLATDTSPEARDAAQVESRRHLTQRFGCDPWIPDNERDECPY